MQVFYHNRLYKATRSIIARYSTTNKSDEPMRNQLVIKQTMQPRQPNNPELIYWEEAIASCLHSYYWVVVRVDQSKNMVQAVWCFRLFRVTSPSYQFLNTKFHTQAYSKFKLLTCRLLLGNRCPVLHIVNFCPHSICCMSAVLSWDVRDCQGSENAINPSLKRWYQYSEVN